MTTGSQSDITSRLQSYMPSGWFGSIADALNITAVLNGIAASLSLIYTLIQFFAAQARLQTSSGGWVDLWAQDFLGANLPRNLGESDASYIARIENAIFTQRGTRPVMINMLTTLTGAVPIIFEPNRPADTACFHVAAANGFFGQSQFASANGYSALITAYRPTDSAHAGATDTAIYAAINATRPCSTNIGVQLLYVGAPLGTEFVLGSSILQ